MMMTRREAAQYLRVSLPTFARLVKQGEAPPVIRLSKRRVGYRQQDLDAWLLSRLAVPTARQMLNADSQEVRS
jgi:excisionase family DNA binding protein